MRPRKVKVVPGCSSKAFSLDEFCLSVLYEVPDENVLLHSRKCAFKLELVDKQEARGAREWRACHGRSLRFGLLGF